VDLYVPNSPALVGYLVEQQRIPREKIVVVENAIDVSPYGAPVDAAAVRRSLAIAPDAFVAVCPAKLHWQKDHETLLRALADVPEVIVLLAGDGPLRATLETLASALGIADRVRFLGWRSDVVPLLKSADVFVLASRFEGMSNSLMEAMAAGVPVAVSRIPENTVLIDDGESGLVFDVGDASALAQALRRLRDPGLRARLTEAAFRRIQRNDVPSLVQRVREVASGSPPR
jgi:glycosyltransferase involved in cell wall biosynthesis